MLLKHCSAQEGHTPLVTIRGPFFLRCLLVGVMVALTWALQGSHFPAVVPVHLFRCIVCRIGVGDCEVHLNLQPYAYTANVRSSIAIPRGPWIYIS